MDSWDLTNLTVAELFRQWPPTSLVFQRLRMACVGCTMAPFCTVEDVVRTYRLDREQFLQSLIATIEEASHAEEQR